MRRPSSTGWPPPDGSGDPADAESLRPTSRFSSRADAYVRARPDYPSALFQLLSDDLSLESDPIIADVGAGTGILTGQLLARGYRVVAVEPNARMRTHAEAEFGANDRFRSVDGTAEATGLPDDSVDLAIVAQAFHWFNPAPAATEFRRFLRPDRLAVIVWNIARPGLNAFTDGYLALLTKWGTDYQAVVARHADPTLLAAFFRGGRYERRSLDNAQHLDAAGWRGRIESSSYMPSAGDPGYDGMRAEMDALFAEHESGDQVTIRYETPVFWGRV